MRLQEHFRLYMTWAKDPEDPEAVQICYVATCRYCPSRIVRWTRTLRSRDATEHWEDVHDAAQ